MMSTDDAASKMKGALCLGEFGALTDLSGDKSYLAMVQAGIKSPNPEVRLCVSVCLGNMTIGKPNYFLG